MVDAFAASCFNQQDVPTPLGDALANMRVIDAAFARERRPVAGAVTAYSKGRFKDYFLDKYSRQDGRTDYSYLGPLLGACCW